MPPTRPDRRTFLRTAGAMGCSLAASPLVTPVALAAAPTEQRLVVVLLRGGLDGLDAVRPLGDRLFAPLRRGALDMGGAVPDLDGYFGLHPALGGLHPLWTAGELAFAHAVSTPYRHKRSHFDGQKMLEAGAGFLPGEDLPQDGWLNRMLQVMPGMTAETALAAGRDRMLMLRGPAPHAAWAPEIRLGLSPTGQSLLTRMSAQDPLFARAAERALIEMQRAHDTAGRQSRDLAAYVAARMQAEVRIAAFSINGWDTHAGQAQALPARLGQLAEVILTLRADLGPALWGRTAVVALTEFGRSARSNGSGGTDHGTGGVMILAGGGLRGGRVHGRWPGLSDSALFEGRDLMPTEDVRAYLAALMRAQFGLGRSTLERTIFPGLDMAQVPELLA